MQIEITHDIDQDGTPIVFVPLQNSDQSAVLFEEDFNRLIDIGLDARWKLANGQVLERGRSRLSIARLVADAKAGEKILLKDRNQFNLRRDNLVTAKGGSSRETTRDRLSPDTRPHNFLNTVKLKHTHKPLPWQGELCG
jgi:hypothetical protein